jgi:hypothetical protein
MRRRIKDKATPKTGGVTNRAYAIVTSRFELHISNFGLVSSRRAGNLSGHITQNKPNLPTHDPKMSKRSGDPPLEGETNPICRLATLPTTKMRKTPVASKRSEDGNPILPRRQHHITPFYAKRPSSRSETKTGTQFTPPSTIHNIQSLGPIYPTTTVPPTQKTRNEPNPRYRRTRFYETNPIFNRQAFCQLTKAPFPAILTLTQIKKSELIAITH